MRRKSGFAIPILIGELALLAAGLVVAANALLLQRGSANATVGPSMRIEALPPSLQMTAEEPLLAQFGRDRPDFFERGQDRLEEEIRRLETGKPGDGLLSIQGEQLRWQQVVFKQGGFAVWLPAAKIAQEQETVETPIGMLEFSAVTSQPGGAKFAAAYAERPAGEDAAILKAVGEGLAKESLAETLRDRAVSFQGHPGRELIFQDGYETVAVRIYLTPQRIYVLGVLQPSGEATSTATNPLSKSTVAFFKSFRLLR